MTIQHQQPVALFDTTPTMYNSNLGLPGEAAKETILVLLLNNLAIHNSEVLELARRNTSSVQDLDVGVAPVLGFRLQEIEARHNEELSANEQEHDLAAPVELIGVDEVREHRGQHQGGELLADQGERDGLRASSLRGSLLSNGPAVAADGTGVEHGPGDHEGEQSGVGGDVRGTGHGGAGDDDTPEHQDCATADHTLAARDDVGEEKGDEVGEKLEGRGDGGQSEGVLLADELEVVSLSMLLVHVSMYDGYAYAFRTW